VNAHVPGCFKDAKYSATRVIVDCTELNVQKPSSLVRNGQFFSAYKGHSTTKSLIGIPPPGTVTFVPMLYTGSMSDIEITKQSGLLDLLEPGDTVMSDKGFNASTLVRDRKVGLNMPAFPSGGQFTPEEVQENQGISSLRVHVERVIPRCASTLGVWKPESLMDCGSSVDKLQANSSEQVCTEAFGIF